MSTVTAGAHIEMFLPKSQNCSLCKLERTSGFLKELPRNVPVDLGSLAQFCLALQIPSTPWLLPMSFCSQFVLVHTGKSQRHSMVSPRELTQEASVEWGTSVTFCLAHLCWEEISPIELPMLPFMVGVLQGAKFHPETRIFPLSNWWYSSPSWHWLRRMDKLGRKMTLSPILARLHQNLVFPKRFSIGGFSKTR